MTASDQNDGADRGCRHHAQPDCLTCRSSGTAGEWCSLSEDQARRLNAVRVTNTYRTGQVLFYQGNPCLGLYCVESGEIAIRKTSEQGVARIVRLVHSGQTLGYRAYFSGEPYAATAEALVESRVCFIPREIVHEFLMENPALSLSFLHHVAKDLRESEEEGLSQLGHSVRTRVAQALLGMKDRLGTVSAEGELIIDVPMSRQDLAALVGARPETITRAIRSLENDSVAFFDGRRVRVPDLDRLLDELEAPDEG